MIKQINVLMKTKPENPKRSVKYGPNQWGYVSKEMYDEMIVGNTYTVDEETTEKGYVVLHKADNGSKTHTAPAQNGAMTREDWARKDQGIARQAVMKSCLESPALAEAVKVSQDLVGTSLEFFDAMWSKYNESK